MPIDNQAFKMTYEVINNKIESRSQCDFNEPSGSDKHFKDSMNKLKSKKPDLESIFYELSKLAQSGNKQAADFFMKPSKLQKKILNGSDGAASTKPIYDVLNFMKKNNCTW